MSKTLKGWGCYGRTGGNDGMIGNEREPVSGGGGGGFVGGGGRDSRLMMKLTGLRKT